jgi:hypothetical protein
MQHLVFSPDPQPPAATAMAYDVGGKLVRGNDKIIRAPPR